MRRRAGVRIAGISDPGPQAREATAELFGLTSWSDHRELLEAANPTLVAIAAPDSGQIVIDALRHGADVLVAPPVCQSAEELDTIARIADETGRQVVAAHTYRGHPAARTAVELLGQLGTIELVSLSIPGGADHAHAARSIVDTYDVFTVLLGTTADAAELAVDAHPDPADDVTEVSEALGALLLTATVGGPEGPVLEVRRQPESSTAREIIQVIGENGAVEWDVRDGMMRSAFGDRDPLTLSCGSFVHPEEWVLNNLIRRTPPVISTAHSLAAMRLLLTLEPAIA